MIFWRFQVRRFVLLFEGRTGSTYFMEALAQHPHIEARGEMLDPLLAQGAAAQLAWTRRYLTPPWRGPHKAIGFKTKLRAVLDPLQFADLLRRHRVFVIHMQRRNRIKSVISTFRVMQLNAQKNDTDRQRPAERFNIYAPDQRPPPLPVDIAKFREILQQRTQREQALAAYIADLRRPTLDLFYEDLMLTPTRTFDQVFDFLAVPSHPVSGQAIKLTSDDLRHVVLNFDELRSAFTGTPYLSMFDEVLTTPAEPPTPAAAGTAA